MISQKLCEKSPTDETKNENCTLCVCVKSKCFAYNLKNFHQAQKITQSVTNQTGDKYATLLIRPEFQTSGALRKASQLFALSTAKSSNIRKCKDS